MNQVHHIRHPLVQHKLTLMRRKDASTNTFRHLLNELSALMAYEITRDMPVQEIEIETPLETTTGQVIDGKKLVLVSILRAGTGILDGMLKMPSDMEERDAILVDPMLATGNSAVAAIDKVKALNPRSIKFCCLLTCPEGIATVHRAHPDVPIYTAAIDRCLNDHGYILPGLGDAGDRIFGTS